MPKISKRTIDELIASGAVGKPIRDDDVKGFQARLNKDGSVSYSVEYRPGRGRVFPVRRVVLGKHGRLTPYQARCLAKTTLAAVLGGNDPAAERANRRNEMTVADCLRHALATHWRPKAKPSTARNFEAMIERTLIPKFGTKRLSDLTRADIRGWHGRQTHRPRQANLDLAILRKALNLAVGDGLIKENPATGIQPHPEHRRDRVPSDVELTAILDALNVAHIRPQAALLIKLLLFSGARSGEWRVAEWSWLDADGRTLRLPDAAAKTGARWIALSTSVQAFLSATPRTSRFIVPDDSGEAPLAPWSAIDAWQTVCRAANVDDLHLHDLRHAFATRCAGLGASAILLRDALGHKTLQMTSRYISRQTDPVRQLAERVGAQIQSLGEGVVNNIVDFAKKA
jgi:integrase